MRSVFRGALKPHPPPPTPTRAPHFVAASRRPTAASGPATRHASSMPRRSRASPEGRSPSSFWVPPAARPARWLPRRWRLRPHLLREAGRSRASPHAEPAPGRNRGALMWGCVVPEGGNDSSRLARAHLWSPTAASARRGPLLSVRGTTGLWQDQDGKRVPGMSVAPCAAGRGGAHPAVGGGRGRLLASMRRAPPGLWRPHRRGVVSCPRPRSCRSVNPQED